MRRSVLAIAIAVAAFMGTTRASADPAPISAPVVDSGAGQAPATAASLPPGEARSRLKTLLQTLDADAARLASSGDPDAVVEAAKARASFAEAMEAVDQLSDAQAESLLNMLPLNALGEGLGREAAVGEADEIQALIVDAPSQADQAELDELRRDLDDLFIHYGNWSYLVPGDDEYLSYVSDARGLVARLTYDDLAAVDAQLGQIPSWQTALAPDLTSMIGGGTTSAASVVAGSDAAAAAFGPADGGASSPESPSLALAPVGGASTDGSITPDRRPTIDAGGQCPQLSLDLTTEQVAERIIAESVLRYVALALKFGTEIAPKDIKITVLGVTIDIPNPYTLLMGIAKLVVNRVADGLAADVSVIGYCTSVVHWQYTKLHAQSEIDRSQDILFQELDFYNRMTERYNALDLSERELWKLQLQLAIEENLLLDAPRADGSDENRIALYQFTDTVCFNPEELLPTPLPPFEPPVAPTPEDPIDPPDRHVPLPTLAPFVGPPDPREECGLHLVRKLVAETILHNQQAGQNVHNAPSLLAAGDSFLANQAYGQAYIRFRQAYQAAVKPDPSPNSQ